MPKAGDLLRQGRSEELWQMCCGFLRFNIADFMAVQKRLLEQQLTLLNASPLGEKIMRGARPKTLEEFRRSVPLTTYRDYCPELMEEQEAVLPARPEQWVHSSGRSGDYPYKWVPLPAEFCRVLSEVSYGLGVLCACDGWEDVSHIPACPRIVYAVAPRPYISGALASLLEKQSPSQYLPPLDIAESMPFEERIGLGFRQALSRGFDCFFGISIVLVTVSERFHQALNREAVARLLTRPRALLRLLKGLVKSRLAGRPLLPRDLWSLRGIMSSGLDSWVYRDKIKELWGRYPLDIYAGTEGGIYATQTWDYESMTFIPNLNFLEFVPEEEIIKWEMDRSYQPQTLLLDEVQAGENYEIVITNFHGGAMIRYRPGDIIRITSLRNDKLGIDLPQMVFERRTDDILDFTVVKLTEKKIWQAIENTGVAYEDWIAYKEPGETVLHLLIEPKEGERAGAAGLAAAITRELVAVDAGERRPGDSREDWRAAVDFSVEVGFLPGGTFADYRARRQAEGADPAHLKPPHLNPSGEMLTILVTKPEKAAAEVETGTGPVQA